MRVSKAYNTTEAMASLMFRLTPGATQGASLMQVALFSGTPPTDDQLQALLTTTANSIPWNATVLAPFASATNFLGTAVLGQYAPVMDYDNNSLLLPLSAQQNMTTIVTAGTPTWFLLRLTSAVSAAETFAGFAGGTNAFLVMTGTVGDENSSADMRIVGGAVVVGQSVRLSDMRIKF